MKILYITSDSGWGGSSVALFNIIENLCTYNKIVVFHYVYDVDAALYVK